MCVLANQNNLTFEDKPLISFCIPTLNSEKTLEQCLISIQKQKYPAIEIVIVDGYSKDATLDIARKYTDKIWLCKGPLGMARQISIEKSSGIILALFDDDVIIPYDRWLSKAIKYFDIDENISTVWPIVVSPPKSSLFAKCYSDFSHIVKMERMKKCIGVIGGTIALFRKSSILAVGGFDPNVHWGEDFYIARKLKEYSYKVFFLKDPLFHDTMRSPFEFLKKQIIGSRTFIPDDFRLTELTRSQLIYEHFVIGFKGMLNGLLRERSLSWFYYPLLVFIRFAVYSLAQINQLL